MNQPDPSLTSRRDFIKSTGRIAAVSALAGVALPHVHGAESNTINIGLVGCGGRGGGAAENALTCQGGPLKLIAVGDVFPDKLGRTFDALKRKYSDHMDVPEERKFLGFDAYKKVMDCLKPGDIVILATPPAFRWVHFTYAIEKGLNVFMEKPVTVDGPTTKRMIALGEEAKKKNLKVGVGLMIRHCRARQELFKRIQDGEIGDIIMMRACRMHPPGGTSAFSGPKPADMTELEYQIRRFHSFLWASGGLFSDFYIHQIDECCWMKNKWPVQAIGIGGRHYRSDSIDQNFDSYGIEYSFDDGSKFFFEGRHINECVSEFASHVHGSKGMGIVSTSSHSPGKCRTFSGHTISREKMLWAFPQPEKSPYDWEWDDLVDAIRNNKPYNEVERGAMASLVTSMGRMAAHTGQVITVEQILNGDHEFAPGLDKLTADSKAPLQVDASGKYPVPMPGINKDREYGSA